MGVIAPKRARGQGTYPPKREAAARRAAKRPDVDEVQRGCVWRGRGVVIRQIRRAVKVIGDGGKPERGGGQEACGGRGVPDGAVKGGRVKKDGLREKAT